MRSTKSLSEKLLDNIIPEPNSGCWLWLGTLDSKRSYGVIHHGSRFIRAHRVSFEFHHGKIPNGMGVLHRCDQPSCVNPDHLFIGDQKTNLRDCARKGRASKGPIPRAINFSLIADAAAGIPTRRLSVQYGIPETSVRRMITLSRRLDSPFTSAEESLR